MDQDAQKQVIERLQQATNVLVTVSTNPSVDQLAACIGFTLLLNKVGKHATAVFSGKVPSTIEFLKPEDTIEKNTDSLRDFIIALDKSKADKLRYKVEDKVVKIFITPYRTSLTDKDLEFSQGDFNVDAVVAIGVHERTDLDQAIMAHGRILHDATIISVNNKDQGSIGNINWVSLNASSLSEMLVELSSSLTSDPLDAQMATAFMTGIVAETDRFSNSKTNPRTMTLASELMSAGANQQLIAAKLEEGATTSLKPTTVKTATDPKAESSDGSLQIAHEDSPKNVDSTESVLPPVVDQDQVVRDTPAPSPEPEPKPKPELTPVDSPADQPPSGTRTSGMIMEPPALGGKLTANSRPEDLDPSTDPLSNSGSGPAFQPLLHHPAPANPAVDNKPTLSSLEETLASPHVDVSDPPKTSVTQLTPVEPTAVVSSPPQDEVKQDDGLEDAREAVDQAIASGDSGQPLPPTAAVGSQPIDLNPPANSTGVNPNIPPSLLPPSQPTDTTFGATTNPAAPPPVPPPLQPSNDNPASQ